MIQSYRDLIVWQKAIDLVVEVYGVTKSFPETERYGLTSQMRRAAVSIPANIAEGYARKHRQEYTQFIRVAFASGAELETHLVIAKRLGYIPQSSYDHIESLLTEIMKMLNKFIVTLQTKS